MTNWKTWLVVGVIGLAVGGTAYASLGTAKWQYYRTDLIRCIDAENLGTPACGTEGLGSDPLAQGRLTVDGKRIIAQVVGAAPNALYFIDFIPLRNTDTTPDGAYLAEERRFVGSVTTNKHGIGDVRIQNFSLESPMLGYFVFSSPAPFEEEAFSAASGESLHAQGFENELRQFVTGFDAELVKIQPRG